MCAAFWRRVNRSHELFEWVDDPEKVKRHLSERSLPDPALQELTLPSPQAIAELAYGIHHQELLEKVYQIILENGRNQARMWSRTWMPWAEPDYRSRADMFFIGRITEPYRVFTSKHKTLLHFWLYPFV